MTDFTRQIYRLVKQIPPGRVTTYGELAFKAGRPRASRVVGQILAHCTRDNLPCHRVVKKDGSLSSVFGVMGSRHQRILLENESVTFTQDGKVDMQKHFVCL